MPGVIDGTPEGCEHFHDVSNVPEDIKKFVADPYSFPGWKSTNVTLDIGNNGISYSPNMTRIYG